jgi:hypothetical protein
LRQLLATLSYRGKHLLKPCLKQLLEGSISESTPPIVGLQFVHERGVLLEGIQVREDDISFDLAGIAHTQVPRIGVHPLDRPMDLVRVSGEWDGVSHTRLSKYIESSASSGICDWMQMVVFTGSMPTAR